MEFGQFREQRWRTRDGGQFSCRSVAFPLSTSGVDWWRLERDAMEATYGFAEANNDDELKFDYAQFGEITGLLSIALP